MRGGAPIGTVPTVRIGGEWTDGRNGEPGSGMARQCRCRKKKWFRPFGCLTRFGEVS